MLKILNGGPVTGCLRTPRGAAASKHYTLRMNHIFPVSLSDPLPPGLLGFPCRANLWLWFVNSNISTVKSIVRARYFYGATGV